MISEDKILLVEDQEPWRKSFARIVKDYGELREVVHLDKEDFNRKFRKASDFDSIAYCLIDLELDPHSSRKMNDTAGFDEVLPALRSMAPWVPTGCVSVHLFHDHQILRRVSLGDFDGLFPKEGILPDTRNPKSDEGNVTVAGAAKVQLASEFNADEWRKILSALSKKRVASMIGISVGEVTKRLCHASEIVRNLKMSSTIKVGDELTQFTEALSLLGFQADKMRLNEIPQGHSKINVGRLQLIGHDDQGNYDACWLLKWGRPIRKLHQEIAAHYRMLRRGLDRRLFMPPVYNEVLAWNNVGYIAYRFEKECLSAEEYAHNNGVGMFAEQLGAITKELYRECHKGFAKPEEVLIEWCNLNEIDIASRFGDKAQHPLDVSDCLIHGDFHLHNILISDQKPVLIDFACSTIGPIIIDVAKLAVDSFCRLLPLSDITSQMFSFDECLKSKIGILLNCFGPYLTRPDDKALYSFVAQGFAIRYLEYTDISDEVKSALKKALADVLG